MPSPTDRRSTLSALLHTAACVALPCLLVLALDGCASPTPPAPTATPGGASTAGDTEGDTAGDTAGDTESAPADDAALPDPEAEPDAGDVHCFFGATIQRTPDGTESPAADLLLRRQFEPAASRIVEDTVRYDGATGKVHHYRVVMEVDADAGTFTLRETDGLYAGTGRLEGEPWDWTAWSMSYRLTSGIVVEGRSEVRGDEGGRRVLHGEKTAYGPDGGLALTLVETLPELAGEACEERFGEAVAAGTTGSP